MVRSLFVLTKSNVQAPGSRGGHPWLNEKGEWEYGPKPAGKKTRREAHEQEESRVRREVVAQVKKLPHSPTRVWPNPKNQKQFADSVAAMEENAKKIAGTPRDENEWRQYQLTRLGEKPDSDRKIAYAPTLAIRWSQDGGAGVRDMYAHMDPAVRAEALNGLQHVERNMHLAQDHALTPRAVLLHFIWAILAKSSSPYTQESAFIDLEHSGINYFVDKALEGKFDPAEYKAWLGQKDANVLVPDAAQRGYIHRPPGDPKQFKGLAQGSPGRGVTMNVNIIGKMLDNWSKKGCGPLVDLYTNPDITGQEARRQFWKLGYGGGGVGLNNKILSFATAMLGKPDVMVMDIWQARRFHPETYENLKQLYHRDIVAANGGKETNIEKDGSVMKATSDVQGPYNNPGGPAGLVAYEGLEAMLAKAIKGLPVDKNGMIEGKITPSIFALHWLSWVANFDAAVGHHSLDTVQNLDQEGLSARPQDRSAGLKGTPTADDVLSRLAITHVTEGNKNTRNYLTKYQRGTVPQEQVPEHASLVPTEFMPGSFPSHIKAWLQQQPKSVQAEYAREASQKLEPLFRKLAAARGLAVSVNEGFGGYGGDGNANTQATLVPLDDSWTPEQTQQAVKAFSADLGWAFRQDMAVCGHVVAPGTKGARGGYDFQLNRPLTPDEAALLGRESMRAMQDGLDSAGDVDAGYSMLPNNVVRFINYTDFSSHPMADVEFRNRVARAIQNAVPKLIDRAPGGAMVVHPIGWEGDAAENDWQKDPEGHGYDEARELVDSGRSVQSARVAKDVSDLARQCRAGLEQFNQAFQAQHGEKPAEEVSEEMAAKSFSHPLLLLVKAGEAAAAGMANPSPGVAKPAVKMPVRNEWVHKGAEDYVKHYKIANSLPSHGYAPLHTGTSRTIADAYDKMKHEPEHPAVKEAYHHLVKEVGQQYDFATKHMGMKFEPWTKEGEPYKNSDEMRKDVLENHHLHFFTGGEMPKNHPLAGVDPKTGLTHNDKFRAIHDLFGHAHGGFEFGPRGEENAWIDHRKMFSDKAIPALTSETRGQNSWVNFGKHLRRPDGTIPKKGEAGYIGPADRPFAEQKAGLLPKEFHTRDDIPARDPFRPKKIG